MQQPAQLTQLLELLHGKENLVKLLATQNVPIEDAIIQQDLYNEYPADLKAKEKTENQRIADLQELIEYNQIPKLASSIEDLPAPKTGPEAIYNALKNIDLDSLETMAKDLLRSGKRSKRGYAVKALNAIRGFKRNDIHPTDLMIDKVPVLPTKYRPFAAQGGSLIPGDANVLYKDLFDIKNMHDEERAVFGDEGAGKSRLALYDAARSVYGFGDPVKPKTAAKGVEGFLRKILGSTSKYSYVNRKMIAKPQDNVGRSTIIVDPELGIDQMGIPKSIAFTMYSPYIIRQMVQGGMRAADALTHLKDRDDVALGALETVVKSRPVYSSRAPAWHQFSVIGAWPKLIDGNAIAISPLVTSGLGADFDGNCIKGCSKIVIKFLNFKSIATTTDSLHAMIIKNTGDSGGSVRKISTEPNCCSDFDDNNIKVRVDSPELFLYNRCLMRITHNTKIIARTDKETIVEMAIEDFPRVLGTHRLDKNGATVFNVPKGVQVWASNTDGKGSRWSNVTSFTMEDGCSVCDIETNRKKRVSASSNESLAVFNAKHGLLKVTPDSAIGHFIPVLRSLPLTGDKHTYNFGWIIGAFLSDGWISGATLGYTKLSPKHRTKFVKILTEIAEDPDLSYYVKTYEAVHSAESNCGISGQSTKLHIQTSALPTWFIDILKDLYVEDSSHTGRACLLKKMPTDLGSYSRQALLGILAGFFDGDGSISISNAKSKPQVQCHLYTSSVTLRDGILHLFKLLGISGGYSTTKAVATRVQTSDSFTINPSASDLYELVHEMSFADETAGIKLLRQGVNPNQNDVVPMTYNVLQSALNLDRESIACAGISRSGLETYKSKANKSANKAVLVMRNKAIDILNLVIESHAGVDLLPEAWLKEVKLLKSIADDKTMVWETVQTCKKAETERVYDIAVPETNVFALASGLIVYDTINLHVPSSDEAVKEVQEKLMPSIDPFSAREPDKIVPLPKQEQILGLVSANTRPAKRTHTFNTEQEALKAIENGSVSLSDNVEISQGFNNPTLL